MEIMDNVDTEKLYALAKAVLHSGLTVTASIAGRVDDYDLITYIDSIVVEDSQGNEVVVVTNEEED